MDKIRFAVIGCGHAGKKHAAMILANAESELVACCDVRPRESLDFPATDIPFFSSLEAFLQADLAVDVVNIATPNGLHETQALALLEKGYHVVIEKPMSLTKAGCERIIFKALEKSKLVFCVMQNRYSPPSIWLKKLLTDGILGQIYMVSVECYWNRDQRYYLPGGWHGSRDLDGGTLFTQFSHFVDILYWLFGDVSNIQARFKDFNHGHLTAFEDSGFITFDLEKGGIGSFNYSTAVWNKNMHSSLTIIAENGTVKVGGQYMNEVEYCHIKDYAFTELPPGNPPNDYGGYKGSAANHQYIIENVVDVLKNRASITTNALEGLKVVEIIERIYQSAPKPAK